VPVAVLPFTTASGDKADQYFADALTQLIHNKALRISPQASAFRKLLRDIREVGRKLKVSHLLEGCGRGVARLAPVGTKLPEREVLNVPVKWLEGDGGERGAGVLHSRLANVCQNAGHPGFPPTEKADES
jgi:hypothetical protein